MLKCMAETIFLSISHFNIRRYRVVIPHCAMPQPPGVGKVDVATVVVSAEWVAADGIGLATKAVQRW